MNIYIYIYIFKYIYIYYEFGFIVSGAQGLKASARLEVHSGLSAAESVRFRSCWLQLQRSPGPFELHIGPLGYSDPALETLSPVPCLPLSFSLTDSESPSHSA